MVRPKPEDSNINEEEQSKYKSGVGMLLYLVQQGQPELANATRELSKVMDWATVGQYKELMRVLTWTVDTKNAGLKIAPNENRGKKYIIHGNTDAEFAGDVETRCSVMGVQIFLNRVLINYKSKAITSVTLSITETEYVALSEGCKEVKFVTQILDFLEMEYEKPVVMYVDNVGTIGMVNNPKTNSRTEHVDV